MILTEIEANSSIKSHFKKIPLKSILMGNSNGSHRNPVLVLEFLKRLFEDGAEQAILKTAIHDPAGKYVVKFRPNKLASIYTYAVEVGGNSLLYEGLYTREGNKKVNILSFGEKHTNSILLYSFDAIVPNFVNFIINFKHFASPEYTTLADKMNSVARKILNSHEQIFVTTYSKILSECFPSFCVFECDEETGELYEANSR